MKGIKLFTTAVVLLLFCVQGYTEARPKPDWADGRRSMIEEPDRLLFIGASTPEKSKEKSMVSARQAALAEVGRYFGISVESLFLVVETEVNEKVNTTIVSRSTSTSRKIEVRNSYIADFYTEENTCDCDYVSYVELAVPKKEIARVRAEVEKRQIDEEGLGVLAVKSEFRQCRDTIRDLTGVLKAKYKAGIGDEIPWSDKTTAQIFSEQRKKFYLKVECREARSEEHPAGTFTVFFSQIEVTAELFNLLTGESLGRWTGESGTVSSEKRDETLKKGFSKAVEDIKKKIK